ncbi:hypothetical protein AGDE_03366 [Angomonas deanei]|uniref:Uncharacterized protein n=1 Tax=Angomonas deanei TaxID=59799 RepID=S9VC72_9TRYP|nr:hypothetical protein AGDE_12071 [Angomonas deanei]EPY40562.1 hypothetical protein AGDE_03366 [Angomonas deanei]CAD2219105.1 hypothetical protein, conserved [Angomonas deanei]|eukprot:EPY24990.1 hypothetical protein AGDE_12071 [Angomonas deanei]
MSDTAVALREPSPQELNGVLEKRKSEARSLEMQVSRKEAELRRAREEQVLLKELRTMNEMIIKKREQSSNRQASGLKISQESLSELRALEDELKMENKKTDELQNVSNVISHQMEEVERNLEKKSLDLAVVKQSTGWDVDPRSAKTSSTALNEFLDKKRELTELYNEQKTVRDHTDRLTSEIEALTNQIEEQATLQEQIAEAEDILEQQKDESNQMQEKVKSYERLRKKKERMLDQSAKDTDQYKAIRQIEGDKKVLHNNLSSLRETNVSNSKSVLSLEVRLRQLETRLEAVNLFLRQVFDEVEDDEQMDSVEEGATDVPLQQFEELIGSLEQSRETVLQRDSQLNNHDSSIELLERKVDILQSAISSRAMSSQLQVREKEKEFEILMSHVDQMRNNFERERGTFLKENEALRKKIEELK